MVDDVRAEVRISGNVQGVYYRATTREVATEKGITGWVRNRTDGRVDAVFEGPAPEVEAMIEWCHQGSPAATVESVEVDYQEPTGIDGFAIRR